MVAAAATRSGDWELCHILSVEAAIVNPNGSSTTRLREKGDIEKVNKQMWTQAVQQFEKMSLKNVASSGKYVTEINQNNFALGHYLMRTSYDAYFAELDGDDAYTNVIEDIEILMELFEGERETALLENLLKSIENGNGDTTQIYAVMRELEETYRAELTAEEDWFLLYGEWTTCLIGDTYLGDDEYILEDLYVLQDMVADAPEVVAEQILTPVNDLSKFNEQTSFTAEDYEAISTAAFNIFDLVFANNA